MKDFITFREEWVDTIMNTDVFVNPTRREVRMELDDEYRFILDMDEQKLFAWNKMVPHSTIVPKLISGIDYNNINNMLAAIDKYLMGTIRNGEVELDTLFLLKHNIEDKGDEKQLGIFMKKLNALRDKNFSYLSKYGIDPYDIDMQVDEIENYDYF